MRRIVFALASALFLTTGVFAADSANLGPTFEQGAKARYELTTTGSQTFDAPQGEVTMETQSTLTLACEVVEVNDDGGATVRATIDGIKSSLQSPMFSDGFDSAKPAEEDASSQLAQFLRPMIGKSFTIKFDPTGSNADIKGIDTLLPANQPQAAQMVSQAINAGGLGTAVVGFYILKDGGDMIEVGKTWSDTKTQPAPPLGSITVTTNYDFESIESSVAKVTVDGDAVFNPAPPSAQTQGMIMSIDDSIIEATIRWNTGDDMLKESDSKTVLTLSTTSPAAPDTKQTVRVSNIAHAKRLD